MPDSSITQGTSNTNDASLAAETVRAAFAADTFSLGLHWVYDLEEVSQLHPDGFSGLQAPHSKYHSGKEAGDFTHHGDQSLALLESLAKRNEWSAEGWAEDFAAYWESEPQSYFDGAARDTLANFKRGVNQASGSEDLSAVSRMAPLIGFLWTKGLEEQVAAARECAAVTHGHPAVADSAEFFVRVINALRAGDSYSKSFDIAASNGNYTSNISGYLNSARKKLGSELNAAASSLGQSCSTSKAFPLTLWLALSYGDNPIGLLERNALAGGDNSARGMILAMLLAARGEFSTLPETWTAEQKNKDRINAAIARLTNKRIE